MLEMETITAKFSSIISSHLHTRSAINELPIYQRLPDNSNGSGSPSTSHSSNSIEDVRSQSATNHEFSSSSETLDCLGGPDNMEPVSPSPSRRSFKLTMRLPALKTFLSDFTLGFADGLTVPFALTAGLSSLGETKTVIYAGMAEICAGSISMGIGGYLAAKGDGVVPDDDLEPETPADDEAQEEEKMPLHKIGDDNSQTERVEDIVSRLNLPPHLKNQVLVHARLSPHPIIQVNKFEDSSIIIPHNDPRPPSAILSGLSISLGYLLGGILPLFPYFFVDKVTDGLAWSFGVCVLALFLFGFGKAYALGGGGAIDHSAKGQKKGGRSASKWKRVRRSIWEGVQMVVLGSIAAGAAVVCVSAFESLT